MQQKALTEWRRDPWDTQYDRASPELGCHQAIPGYYRKVKGINCFGDVPLFLRTREYNGKSVTKFAPLQLQQIVQVGSSREVRQQRVR